MKITVQRVALVAGALLLTGTRSALPDAHDPGKTRAAAPEEAHYFPT